MATDGRARRSDPALWERVKAAVTRGGRGGEPGQWSARKAQLAVAEYKKAGGGYEGAKSPGNSLAAWTKEDWGTRSGRPSGETGERYLPRKAREALSDEAYDRSTARKRRDTKAGRQFSAQPADVAAKASRARKGAATPAARGDGRTAAQRSAAAKQAAATRAANRAASRRPDGHHGAAR
ncbi:hypothetical protein LPC08_11885 [Roseomonas sp. OT10]|uniref:hypothetical protein n=1 Tax=Roseomonas cutis TaxID=2897332 RepID=UPI001E649141|nr:hypothetical protein [Roseomonas sp. OT10]UFN51248.1 hypothetical protein LPC08_11885 [Roseomonas sp. OT10]